MPFKDRARLLEYRLAHRDEARAKTRIRMRAWRLSHPDEKRARDKAWNIQHAVEHRARSKAWRLAHPDQVKATNKAWKLVHPDKVWVANQRRRARKQEIPVTLTIAEWRAIRAAYKERCAYCGRKTKLTQDHVLPLSKGGGTTAFNIVPACGHCNSSKRDRLPRAPVKLALGI